MKNSIVLIALALFLSSSRPVPPADCNAESLSTDCIGKLTSGFNFLKTYKIDGTTGSKSLVEYSYVFMKGTQYMINVCPEGGPQGIVVSLFDSKRNQVATSKVNGQVVSAIAFPCNATGIYYIQFSHDGSNSFCGGSAMGFKR